jgi:predicted ABC-type ATPase
MGQVLMSLPEFAIVEPERLAAELSRRGLAWADAEAAAQALEESRKSILAQITTGVSGKSMAEREAMALADAGYAVHLGQMVDARKEANRARVNYDVYKVFVELTRSKIATEREAMRLR